MPWYTMVPPYGDNALNAHAWVPIDDENCFAWTFTYHPTRPLSAMELDTMRKGGGIHVELIPGSFRPVINKDNDYMIDRAAQKAGRTYSGVSGIAMQDASVQESMGPIADRTKENLVSTDNAIIMARHRLRRSALALQHGTSPPGLTQESQLVRSATFVLPLDVPFSEAKREDLQGEARRPSHLDLSGARPWPADDKTPERPARAGSKTRCASSPGPVRGSGARPHGVSVRKVARSSSPIVSTRARPRR